MKHDKIKRLKSRRYVKIRDVRCTRQKRRSVDIVAGSASCFEEKKRASRLKHQIVRAGELHIAMGMIANAAAWLRPFMPLVAHGFSFCLTPLHTRRGAVHRFMFAWAGIFYSCVPLAAFGLPRSAHPPALASAHLSAPFRLPAS